MTSEMERKVDRKIGGFMTAVRRWRRIVIGLLAVGTGIWFSISETQKVENAAAGVADLQAAVRDGVPVLSADRVDHSHDGQLVLIQGYLEAGEVSDPLTGLSLNALGLERVVELYQWQEIRHNKTTRYSKIWSDRIIDSDEFHTTLIGGESHVNPEKMPYDTHIWLPVKDMHLGAWRVAPWYYSQWIGKQQPMPIKVMNASVDPEKWYVSDGGLQNRGPGWKDVRFRYNYIPFKSGTYALLGIPKDGVIDLDERFENLDLIATGKNDAKALLANVSPNEIKRSKFWILYVFLGMVILLRPLALTLHIMKGFTHSPLPRRLLITAAFAAAFTALVGLLTA